MAEIAIPIRISQDDLRAIAVAVHDRLKPEFDLLAAQEKAMSAELDALTARVGEAVAGEEKAITLINGLADQIRSIANDPVALNQLADDLNAETDKLAAAIAAAPQPAAPPTP